VLGRLLRLRSKWLQDRQSRRAAYKADKFTPATDVLGPQSNRKHTFGKIN